MYAHCVFQNLGILKRVVAIFKRLFSFAYAFETALNIDKVAWVAMVFLAKYMQLAQSCVALMIFPRLTAT